MSLDSNRNFQNFKVLGNKILPIMCVAWIIIYWTLGLVLPSPNSHLDHNDSNCTTPTEI